MRSWCKNNPGKIHAAKKKYRENHRAQCTECMRNWRKNNPGKAYATSKKYREDHKEQHAIRDRNYRLQNIEKLRARSQLYYQTHRERIKAYIRSRRKIRAEYNRNWYQTHSESMKTYYRHYANHRRKTDPQYWLTSILRRRLSSALNGNYKSGSAVRDLGCSIAYLKDWLEDHFLPEMTWKNRGKEWHIDHVRPLAMFDLRDRDQLLTACHYTNLRPLWAYDNLAKGSSVVCI